VLYTVHTAEVLSAGSLRAGALEDRRLELVEADMESTEECRFLNLLETAEWGQNTESSAPRADGGLGKGPQAHVEEYETDRCPRAYSSVVGRSNQTAVLALRNTTHKLDFRMAREGGRIDGQ